MARSEVVIELKIGPGLKAALNVVECAEELLEIVPDWHGPEREELRDRLIALRTAIVDSLNTNK